MELKETENIIIEMLRQHFKDDERSFGSIDKHFERNEELAKNNGEHLSYFRKDLTGVMNKVDSIEISIGNIEKFMEKSEPLFETYRDFQGVARFTKGGSSGIIKTALTATGIMGIIEILKRIPWSH